MSLTKASYSMINGAFANVLDFGADSTGATDSTSAFQAAIDSLPVNGGTIFIPTGTFLIDALSFPNNPKIVNVVGSGIDATILQKYSSTGKMFTKAAQSPSGAIDGALFENFTVKAHASMDRTNIANIMFDIQGWRASTWRKIGYKGNGTGAPYAVFDLSINSSPFYPTYQNTFEGLVGSSTQGPIVFFRAKGVTSYLNNSNIIEIRDCLFYYLDGTLAVIDLSNSGVAKVSNCQFESCQAAVAIRCGQSTTVSNNWFEDNAKNLEFDSTFSGTFSASACIIEGNYFSGNATNPNTISGSVNIPPLLIQNTGGGAAASQWTGNVITLSSWAASVFPATPSLSGGNGSLTLVANTLVSNPDACGNVTFNLKYTYTPTGAGQDKFSISSVTNHTIQLFNASANVIATGAPTTSSADSSSALDFWLGFASSSPVIIMVRASFRRNF
jgi:hypothetical protein